MRKSTICEELAESAKAALIELSWFDGDREHSNFGLPKLHRYTEDVTTAMLEQPGRFKKLNSLFYGLAGYHLENQMSELVNLANAVQNTAGSYSDFDVKRHIEGLGKTTGVLYAILADTFHKAQMAYSKATAI